MLLRGRHCHKIVLNALVSDKVQRRALSVQGGLDGKVVCHEGEEKKLCRDLVAERE